MKPSTNGHLGSNGSRAVEESKKRSKALYPYLSMFILLLDCLTF
jgi:hypothetical protein